MWRTGDWSTKLNQSNQQPSLTSIFVLTTKEKGLISGFQKKIQNADGTATLVRSIDQLCIDDGRKDTCRPMDSPVFKKFHMLIATIPPFDQHAEDKKTRSLDPKLATIEFE